MGIRYADFIDPQNIEKVIGSDYQNEAVTYNSGLVSKEDQFPEEGTHMTWIRETLFSSDTAGQTIGVGTEISLKNQTQNEYQLPIVWRADGAEFDDIATSIMTKKRREGIETNLTNSISEKAAQMLDDVVISVIDGANKWIITDTNNYLNKNGSQINLVNLEETKAKRGEKGKKFQNGFIVMRGNMWHKVAALGLVAQTSNTMGNMKQGQIVDGGQVGTILGMNPFVTDKIALESSGGVDHIVTMLEAGAVRGVMSPAPMMDPIVRGQRSFTDSIKFKLGLGAIIKGLSWSGSKVNPADNDNTALATGTNYEQATAYIKNVPMACVRFDAPSF
nr:hypothetical protein 18 [Legionellales bacterium]